MNKAFLLIGIIVMALFGFVAINLVTSQQTGAELDYYLLKDTTEAAMNDAIDYDFYSTFGDVRIDKEKFMDSFIRRFADSVDPKSDYTIKVYDINETPPKVSISVQSNSLTVKKKNSQKIVTNVDMIIETNYKEDRWHTKLTSSKNDSSSRTLTVDQK